MRKTGMETLRGLVPQASWSPPSGLPLLCPRLVESKIFLIYKFRVSPGCGEIMEPTDIGLEFACTSVNEARLWQSTQFPSKRNKKSMTSWSWKNWNYPTECIRKKNILWFRDFIVSPKLREFTSESHFLLWEREEVLISLLWALMASWRTLS